MSRILGLLKKVCIVFVPSLCFDRKAQHKFNISFYSHPILKLFHRACIASVDYVVCGTTKVLSVNFMKEAQPGTSTIVSKQRLLKKILLKSSLFSKGHRGARKMNLFY